MDPFLLFVIFSHCALILNMFQDRTTYSPRDMELTQGLPDQREPETPKRPGIFQRREPQPTTARRNLLNAFENADESETIPMEEDGSYIPQPIDASTPARVETENYVRDETHDSKWSTFLFTWSILFILCVGCVSVLYAYFPGFLFSYLTKEIIVSGLLALLCVMLVSAVAKLAFERKDEKRKSNRVLSPVRTNRQNVTPKTLSPKRRVTFSPERTERTYQNAEHTHQLNIKRTFKGDGTDIWSEFIRYFENVADLNEWENDRKRKVFFTVMRGQAETYAYGLSDAERSNWDRLKMAMDDRFGHKAMKESYVAEAKLRRKKETESFRDFGQAIQDLYRRAYPDNREYVQESSMKTFMDNCSENEDFRLAVKRTRPKTLEEAVTAAMQEECIRVTENKNHKDKKDYKPPVYEVQNKQQSDRFGHGRQSRENFGNDVRKCYKCNSTRHLMRDCPKTDNRSNNGTGSYVTGRGNGRTGSRGTGSQQLNENRPRQ